MTRGCFNPHPSRRTGATARLMKICAAFARFNPHPSRRTGATDDSPSGATGPERVSILTRPEGRVQLVRTRYSGGSRGVSILTRPEGRVQPEPDHERLTSRDGFNPHPSRRTGATGDRADGPASPGRFNPHPSRRTGATLNSQDRRRLGKVSILTRPEGRVQPPENVREIRAGVFQSSPVPKDGCNYRRITPA